MDMSTPSKEPAPASPKASPLDKLSLPALSYEELSERQQSDYIYLVEFHRFSSHHVLRAFQECGQDASFLDIELWCACNTDEPPFPILTFNDLSESQKTIFKHAVNHLGYSVNHVLKAFLECGQYANIYDIEEWCYSNKEESEHEIEEFYSEEENGTAALPLLKSGRF